MQFVGLLREQASTIALNIALDALDYAPHRVSFPDAYQYPHASEQSHNVRHHCHIGSGGAGASYNVNDDFVFFVHQISSGQSLMGALPVGCGGVWLSIGTSYKAINAARSAAFVIAVSIVPLAVRTAAR